MPNRKNVFVHRTANVSKQANIGEGTSVWQFVVVTDGARIGKNCNIGAHCYVEGGSLIGNNVTLKNDVAVWQGVELEDGVFVGPNAIFTNDIYPRSPRLQESRHRYNDRSSLLRATRVLYGASIGAGAMILAGITIGRFATIALGSVVTKSVPDFAMSAGNPAKTHGWMCECGLPLKQKSGLWECNECHRKYQKQKEKLTEFKRRK
jgi:UDP-2-acetamido-3-amino-2,3-dideoxy-glucuronate N-acetyltransferase